MDDERPPRVFFNDFNAASLNIRAMYWYHPPNYWEFMAFTERFNKEVFRRFNEAGIDFAFPTQTLHLAGDPSRPLNLGTRGEKSV
jgi:MscS family membrane protein